MMLGLLLARAGVDVLVLEKHADFLRDFRGDTIHPSTLEVMHELGLPNTLLGVDVVENGELIAADVTAAQLLELVQQHPARLVITLIGGQGHIFGRGNQQLSPAVIRAIGRHNIHLLATKSKIQALNGRPLISDSGDPELDLELSGMLRILCGYNDYVMYRLGAED